MKQHGSITVFLSLIIVLTASVIGAVLEAARWKAASCEVRLRTNLGVDSLFGEYSRDLLDRYDLVFLDGSFGGSKYSESTLNAHLEKYLREWEKGGEEAAKLLKINLLGVKLKDYMLVTDNAGEAFLSQVYEFVLNNGAHTGELLGRFNELKDYGEGGNKAREGTQFQEELKQSDKELEELEKGDEENKFEIPKDSPMGRVKTMRGSSMLKLVVNDTSKISTKRIREEGLVSRRRLRRGTMQGRYNRTLPDTAAYFMLAGYVLDHFSNAASPGADKPLSYEAEYIINGSGSDEANLEAVAKRLLLMREGANFVYLMTDAAKKSEAYAMAAALAGATAMPALIGVIQKGILLAWAYAESVEDVRTILDGGRVPIIKTAASWKTSLKNIGKKTSASEGSRDSGEGYGYREYLRLLLYCGDKKEYCLRCMDLIEADIRTTPGNESFRMDNCIALAKFETSWSFGGPVLPFPGIGILEGRTLSLKQTKGYYYGSSRKLH